MPPRSLQTTTATINRIRHLQAGPLSPAGRPKAEAEVRSTERLDSESGQQSPRVGRALDLEYQPPTGTRFPFVSTSLPAHLALPTHLPTTGLPGHPSI
jgi:hypothetical protein